MNNNSFVIVTTQVTFEEFVSLYGCSDADFERVVTTQSAKATAQPAQVI